MGEDREEESWYWGSNGEPRGPVAYEELRALADAGRLKATDLVWKQQLPDWVAAERVVGLSRAVASPDGPGASGETPLLGQPLVSLSLSRETSLALVSGGLSMGRALERLGAYDLRRVGSDSKAFRALVRIAGLCHLVMIASLALSLAFTGECVGYRGATLTISFEGLRPEGLLLSIGAWAGMMLFGGGALRLALGARSRIAFGLGVASVKKERWGQLMLWLNSHFLMACTFALLLFWGALGLLVCFAAFMAIARLRSFCESHNQLVRAQAAQRDPSQGLLLAPTKGGD